MILSTIPATFLELCVPPLESLQGSYQLPRFCGNSRDICPNSYLSGLKDNWKYRKKIVKGAVIRLARSSHYSFLPGRWRKLYTWRREKFGNKCQMVRELSLYPDPSHLLVNIWEFGVLGRQQKRTSSKRGSLSLNGAQRLGMCECWIEGFGDFLSTHNTVASSLLIM